MSLFDLNVHNYNREEIEKIFDLPEKYDEQLIDAKALLLADKIFVDASVEEKVKENVIEFIKSAKKKLVNYLDNIDLYHTNHKLRISNTNNSGNTSLIERPRTPWLNSQPSEFFPGVINPLKKRIITQQLNIDTRFRDNYRTTNASNIQFELPNKFSKIVSMELSTFQNTYTFYAISAQQGNNFFTIRQLNDDGSPVFATIVIPDGNYNETDFTKTVQTALDILPTKIRYQPDFNTSSGTNRSIFANFSPENHGGDTTYLTLDSNGQTVPGGYDPTNTEKPFVLDFQSDINGNVDFTTPLQKKMGWLLGFRYGIYGSKDLITQIYGSPEKNCDEINEIYEDIVTKNSIQKNLVCKYPFDSREMYIKLNTFTDDSYYISEGVLDLVGTKYMYLVINDYNNNVVNNNFYSVFQNSMLNNNILARINLHPTVSDNNTFVAQPREYFGPVYIQKLNIQLINEYGDVMDLNNMDYSFCLSLKMIYDL